MWCGGRAQSTWIAFISSCVPCRVCARWGLFPHALLLAPQRSRFHFVVCTTKTHAKTIRFPLNRNHLGQCEYDRHAREAKDPAGVAFAWGARLKPSDNNNNKQRVGATLFLVGGSTRPTTSNTSSLGERVFNNYIYLFRFSNDPGHQPKVGCQ
jgi:hypothetical protein